MPYAVINAALNGDNQLVAGVSGRRVRVLSYVLVSGGSVNAKFTDGPGGTALTGAMPLAAQTVVAGQPSPPRSMGEPPGHFQTGPGNDLTLNLSSGVQVSGHLTYEFAL